MGRRQGAALAVAQWILRALAVFSLLGAVAVVVGTTGTKSLYDRHIPHLVTEQAQQLWPGSSRLPSSPVLVRPAHVHDSPDAFNVVPTSGRTTPAGWAELVTGNRAVPTVGRAGQLTFWDPGAPERTAWLVAEAAVPVGLAWLWWTLSRMVGSARRGDPFDARNARRLTLAGLLVLAGPPLAILAHQLVLQWMLATSTAGGKADIWFRWQWVPLWPLGAGLALIVLGAVWRRGVAMRQDLEGLV